MSSSSCCGLNELNALCWMAAGGTGMLAEAHIYPIALAIFCLIGKKIAESHWDS